VTGKQRLILEVTDQAGRTASATVDVVVEPGKILTVPPSGAGPAHPQGGGGGGGIGSSSPSF
jgi:hypothetical protein